MESMEKEVCVFIKKEEEICNDVKSNRDTCQLLSKILLFNYYSFMAT